MNSTEIKYSRGEDLQIEEPVFSGDCPAFHFHATLAGMLGPTLIRHPSCTGALARDKRLLAATRMMEPFIMKSFRSIALCAWSHSVLIAGICGSSRTAYQPAFLS